MTAAIAKSARTMTDLKLFKGGRSKCLGLIQSALLDMAALANAINVSSITACVTRGVLNVIHSGATVKTVKINLNNLAVVKILKCHCHHQVLKRHY